MIWVYYIRHYSAIFRLYRSGHINWRRGGTGVHIEILDLSHAIGYLNHIKYPSQRTGCELTTVHSSGPFIGGEEEPEYI